MEKVIKNHSIALLVPSRKRASNVKRLVNSISNTAENKNNVTIYFYIDDDDFDTLRVVKSLKKRSDCKIEYLVGPRIIMSEMVNKLYPLTAEFILFFGADDIVFRTNGWDSIIIEAVEKVPDGIGLFYGDDLVTTQHAPDFATHPIVTRTWVDVVGYLSPPYFSCDYADTWLNDIADMVGRKFPLPFVNEHMHPTVGKAEYDTLYQENRQKFTDDEVPSLYREHLSEVEDSANNLKKYIKEAKND